MNKFVFFCALALPSTAFALDVTIDLGTIDSVADQGSPTNNIVDLADQLLALTDVSQVRVQGTINPATPSWSSEASFQLLDGASSGLGILDGWGADNVVTATIDSVVVFGSPIEVPDFVELFERFDDSGVDPDGTWTNLTLTFTGTENPCLHGPDADVCEATEFARVEANASYGSNIVRESQSVARLRPSSIYNKLDRVHTIGANGGCDPVSTPWAGAYTVSDGIASADGMTVSGGAMSATSHATHISGDVDATDLGDSYEKVATNGKTLFNFGNDSVAGYFVRVKGNKGVWMSLQGPCADGDTLYTPWLGSAPH